MNLTHVLLEIILLGTAGGLAGFAPVYWFGFRKLIKAQDAKLARINHQLGDKA